MLESQKLSVIRSDFIHVSHGNPGEEGDTKVIGQSDTMCQTGRRKDTPEPEERRSSGHVMPYRAGKESRRNSETGG